MVRQGVPWARSVCKLKFGCEISFNKAGYIKSPRGRVGLDLRDDLPNYFYEVIGPGNQPIITHF